MKKNILIINFLLFLALKSYAQATLLPWVIFAGGIGGFSNLENGLSNNVVKDTSYQSYFISTDRNYLTKYDSINNREIWVFQITEEKFATYFLIREEGDLAILCSTEIKDACNCRWDLYYYKKSKDEKVWFKSRSLFSVRNKLSELIVSEFNSMSNNLEEMRFCDLITHIQE